MLVNNLVCFDFRNITEANLAPCEKMNVICGENAQGKTNLIEAIWMFTGAKSFRSVKDSSFIHFGQDMARIKLSFTAKGIENSAQMLFGEKREAFLNEKVLQNPSLLAGAFNAIVFSPSDLSLVKDGPAVRRRFMDIAIGQIYPNYITLLRDYTRAITQRNQIIKDYRHDKTLSIMLDVFEKEIALNGKKITDYRTRYIAALYHYVPVIYKGLSSGREKIEVHYQSSCDPNDFTQKLFESRNEDMFTGTTSVGPHRDDLNFLINNISARSYGSQGQQRSVALSLKLAQAQLIEKITGEYPVCLLDDVMSELDPIRQNYVLNHIEGCQSFLTCCDPSNITNLKSGKVFTVKNGKVTS